MQKAKVYVGVDSHSKFHKAAVLPAFLMEGTTVGDEDYWDKEVKPKLERYQFGNDRDSYQGFDEALQALAAPEQVVIGLEYTGGHYTAPLTYFLSGLGYQLWFIEAKAFKEFKEKFLGQRNKTDKVDSAEMSFYLYARAALQRKLRISIIKPEIGTESAILKNLIIQRWSTQKSINQTTNRLHQLLIASFPEGEAAYFDQLLTIIQEYPTPQAILDESNGLAEFKGMRHKPDILNLAAETVGVPGHYYDRSIKVISQQRDMYRQTLDILNDEITAMVEAHPYGKILCSFPQVSVISAATLISIIRDIDRYETPRKLQMMLGVAPGIRQTGKSKGRGKMVYEGNSDGRRIIYQIIFGCIGPRAKPNDVKDLYAKLKAKGKPGKSAMMRCSVVLCEQIYYCLKNGVFYEYQGVKDEPKP